MDEMKNFWKDLILTEGTVAEQYKWDVMGDFGRVTFCVFRVRKPCIPYSVFRILISWSQLSPILISIIYRINLFDNKNHLCSKKGTKRIPNAFIYLWFVFNYAV